MPAALAAAAIASIRSGETLSIDSARNAPWGNFDRAVRIPQSAFLAGWAVDGDAPAAAIDVAIYVNGRFAARVAAGVDRPEIAPYLPGFGSRHGWGALVPIKGRSNVCAYAIDVAPEGQSPAGPNTAIGCTVIAR